MAEIAVDEWLVEYLSPFSKGDQIELAITFICIVKTKCDKIIFTQDHLKRFENKVNQLKSKFHNTSYFPLILQPFTLLLHNSDKVVLRAADNTKEIEGVSKDDLPVARTALNILTNEKYLVTTDSKLCQILGKYGVKCISPEDYVKSSIMKI
jgi:hypothetical protein